MEDKRDGTWGISGTFSPALLQKGIDETIKQLMTFAEKGITEGMKEEWTGARERERKRGGSGQGRWMVIYSFYLFLASHQIDLPIFIEELATKKSTISGTFKVNLATTGGLASAILDNVERGYNMQFLDDYPNMINNIQFSKVSLSLLPPPPLSFFLLSFHLFSCFPTIEREQKTTEHTTLTKNLSYSTTPFVLSFFLALYLSSFFSSLLVVPRHSAVFSFSALRLPPPPPPSFLQNVLVRCDAVGFRETVENSSEIRRNFGEFLDSSLPSTLPTTPLSLSPSLFFFF